MKTSEALDALRKLGKPGTAAIYRRHGLGEDAFGVSFADLGKLAKELGRDQALALALWDSGNVDARFLATMVADPARLDAKTAEAWATAARSSLVDLVAGLVAKAPFAPEVLDRWRASKKESVRATGYALVAALLKDGAPLEERLLRRVLEDVAREIHGSPNRARAAMNNAVIAIGTWRLPEEAIAAARRVGKVEVDHGDTACKTPDAVSYIEKARARAAVKASPRPRTGRTSASRTRTARPAGGPRSRARRG